MMNRFKRTVAVGAIVATLTIGAAAVSAQEQTQPSQPGQQQGQMLPPGQPGGQFGFGQPGGRPGNRFGQGQFGNQMNGPMAGEALERVGGQFVLRQAADMLGIRPVELAMQLRGDVTLAQVLTEAGQDPNALIATVVADATERLSQAVTNGRMTQETADMLLSELQTRINEAVTTSSIQLRSYEQGERVAMQLASERLGVETRELISELRGGQSLADVLTSAGIDLNAFISDVSARMDARLNVMVVDGEITTERSAEILAAFQSFIAERINHVFGQGGQAAPIGA